MDFEEKLKAATAWLFSGDADQMTCGDAAKHITDTWGSEVCETLRGKFLWVHELNSSQIAPDDIIYAAHVATMPAPVEPQIREPEQNLASLADQILSGPVNNTLYMLYVLIRDNKTEAAQRLYHWDGDRVWEYRHLLDPFLGCRLHNQVGCPRCK